MEVVMKVLLAVDIHDDAVEAVVARGAQWAEQLKATLDLLYVSGTWEIADLITDPDVKGLLKEESERSRKQDLQVLDGLLAKVPEARRGSALMLPGKAPAVIADTAGGYDALLVATHGRTGMQHFWLGSVAEHVVRRSPVPVLTMRIPAEA